MVWKNFVKYNCIFFKILPFLLIATLLAARMNWLWTFLADSYFSFYFPPLDWNCRVNQVGRTFSSSTAWHTIWRSDNCSWVFSSSEEHAWASLKERELQWLTQAEILQWKLWPHRHSNMKQKGELTNFERNMIRFVKLNPAPFPSKILLTRLKSVQRSPTENALFCCFQMSKMSKQPMNRNTYS
jgi:hypothetical protein